MVICSCVLYVRVKNDNLFVRSTLVGQGILQMQCEIASTFCHVGLNQVNKVKFQSWENNHFKIN